MGDYYTRILKDGDCIQAFAKAINRHVKPDDIVVDLETGVGTYAMIVERAGAKSSIGIELNPIVNVAHQIAERNGSNVEFMQGDARNIQLNEPASVFVFEDFSTGLLDGIAPCLERLPSAGISLPNEVFEERFLVTEGDEI